MALAELKQFDISPFYILKQKLDENPVDFKGVTYPLVEKNKYMLGCRQREASIEQVHNTQVKKQV